ncbi:MAG: PEP-CTERM sorting domain-containing protein [Armatimonadetes bacterium]|nr:PEP-CTERM sorting domain-containing protein [Armatimonadota bacterium]
MKIRMTLAALTAVVAGAQATNLTANFNVDNDFFAYISTDDSVLGTYLFEGHNWPTTYTATVGLTAGQTNYLHVIATNAGGPYGLLGTLSLDDAGFWFDNNTQSAISGTDWRVNTTGFGNAYNAATFIANNGGGPWGFIGAPQSPNAQWIWSDSDNGTNRYFSIRLNTDVAVPEPASMLALAMGAAALIKKRRS